MPPFDLLPPLLRGLWLTLIVFAGGVVVATICAFLAGLGRRSTDPIVRAFSAVYVEVFRGTSALVQLYWFYFALPMLLDIRLHPVFAGILVLGLNVGAYGAEVVRAAVESVPRGQWSAATALNMTHFQAARYIVLPQALLIMLPPFGNLLIELLKSTALVSQITVTDLLQAGDLLQDQTFRTIEIFSLVLVIYFILSMVITVVVRRLERLLKHRLGQEERQ